MDKKTLPIVVILILLIIFWWDILGWLGIVKPAQQTAGTPPADTTHVAQVDTTEKVAAPVTTADTAVHAAVVDTTPVENIKPDTFVVKTRNYVVTLSSLGGGPVSLRLKNYSYRDGAPIEMLPNCSAATPEITFAAGTVSTTKMPFKANVAPGEYDATVQPFDLIFTYASPQGGEIIRKFRFVPDKYDYQFTVQVNNRDKLGYERLYHIAWNCPLGTTEPDLAGDNMAMEAVAMMSGSRAKLGDFEDGKLNQSETGGTSWAGVRSKYFSAVLIPNRIADGVFAQGTKHRTEISGKRIEQVRVTAGLEMPFEPVASFADTFTVFAGPLDYTLMAGYNVDLQAMVDIGTSWLGWVIKPFALAIIWLLPRMYSLFPNYGLVIILFALLIKLITLPLSLKQYKSMNAMRELQPKIEELKKRLKNSPQQLQTETMKLYKEHGVNPLSGCLPLLAQMPLFFAMFSVFRATILLRNAPFIWPILDLSRGATGITDPYIVLVVLMVVFQYISQILTMSGSGTQQNKMLMYIMPLVFGFLFFSASAGLVLYWACFSLFSIGDYLFFRRRMMKNTEVKTI